MFLIEAFLIDHTECNIHKYGDKLLIFAEKSEKNKRQN